MRTAKGYTMRGAIKNIIKNEQMQKKYIALALLVCFSIVPLLSTVYIIIHACHEHEHYEIDDDCAVCEHILIAKSLLRQIGAAVKIMAYAFANLFAAVAVLCAVSNFCSSQTLVNLKIRMNN